MSLNSRRWRGVALWLGLGALVSPLGFNCHSRTDQSPAVQTASDTYHPDDADQTVRELASVTPDGAPASSLKVRLTSGVTLSAAQASAQGLSSKLSSASDAVIPKGTSLLALYDNDCRERSGALSATGSKSGLKFEAEAFQPATDVSLAALTAQAEADPCLVRIDENQVHQMAAPVEGAAHASASTSAAALATANDPMIASAHQIASSKVLQAWDWFNSGSGTKTDVIVAIVDSGVTLTHPDLIDNLYTDSAGKHGFDFTNNDDDPSDDYGHGTHVAGIVGARANNGIGITGVIGTRVKLMAVKVLDNQGSGSFATIANGVRYAADQGAHVINLSLGGKFTSITIRDALAYAVSKGAVVTTAAGNDGALMDATTNFYAPSGYAKDIPGVLAVGSVDADTGVRSTFSNYSTTYVWIAAPGSGGILSTYLANTYKELQGTSMASPVVAGTAALLVGAFRSQSIAYTPQDVTGLITESARSVPTLNTQIRSGATLDVERAARLFYSRYVMAGNGGTDTP